LSAPRKEVTDDTGPSVASLASTAAASTRLTPSSLRRSQLVSRFAGMGLISRSSQRATAASPGPSSTARRSITSSTAGLMPEGGGGTTEVFSFSQESSRAVKPGISITS